jgi:hypothetical protein
MAFLAAPWGPPADPCRLPARGSPAALAPPGRPSTAAAIRSIGTPLALALDNLLLEPFTSFTATGTLQCDPDRRLG